MNQEEQKEITYLALSSLGPAGVAALIAAGSPVHNCCSFFPEILMIMIPGAYCFYALRSILKIKIRAALLVFALTAALAVLTVAKTVPIEEEQEKEKEKTELSVTPKKKDFNSISNAFKKGFN